MSDRETLEQLRHWIRSAGVSGMEGVEPPPQAEADAAIRSVLERAAEAEARIDAALAEAEDVNTPDNYRKIERIVKALKGEE